MNLNWNSTQGQVTQDRITERKWPYPLNDDEFFPNTKAHFRTRKAYFEISCRTIDLTKLKPSYYTYKEAIFYGA